MASSLASTSTSTVLPPLPPAGFTPLRASPEQILLPLTISNKCGQSFRWRAIKVWDRRRPEESTDVNPASVSQVKVEPGLEDDEALKPMVAAALAPVEEWTEYSFCLPDRVVLVRQDEERGYLYHRTLFPPDKTSLISPALANEETSLWLSSYLNLGVPLEALYEEWSSRDPIFAQYAQRFQGVRMIRQDPWECLCSFICSSNNNIARIGGMVQNLCTHFSPKLMEVTYGSETLTDPFQKGVKGGEGEDERLPSMTIDYHPFPSPQALAQDGVEEKLRQLGFGYRARYINQTAKMLCEEHTRREEAGESGISAVLKESGQINMGNKTTESVKSETDFNASIGEAASPQEQGHSVHSYLASLRTMSYSESRSHLMRFPGVGPKVADCILLMSLDQPSSIPVDRHVFQFAARHYHLKSKEQIKYDNIVKFFRQLWGEWAGWAHSILFVGDLRSFKDFDGSVKKEEEEEKPLPTASDLYLKQPSEAKVEAEGSTVVKSEVRDSPMTGGQQRKESGQPSALQAATVNSSVRRKRRGDALHRSPDNVIMDDRPKKWVKRRGGG